MKREPTLVLGILGEPRPGLSDICSVIVCGPDFLLFHQAKRPKALRAFGSFMSSCARLSVVAFRSRQLMEDGDAGLWKHVANSDFRSTLNC